jgi:cell division protein FtsQ
VKPDGQKRVFLAALRERIRRIVQRQDRRPFFAGRFFSNGTKVIQTARNTPERRQKVNPRQRMIVARRQQIRQVVSLCIKVTVTTAGAAALAAHVTKFALTSPTFALAHIGVSGNTNVTAQTVIRQSGLREGRNIFTADISDVAEAIAALPRVGGATVRRELPDEIHIEIKERSPVALVLAKDLLLVDRERKIIGRYDPSEETNLPVITGRGLSSLSVGEVVEVGGFEQAIEIIDVMAELGISESVGISEINIDQPEDLLMVAESSGATIHLGSGKYRDKLWRLAAVAEEIQRNERLRVASLERLDMRFESIIPAKFSGG